MNLHRAAAAVVIPLAASLHAYGYYSVRSLAWRQGTEHLGLEYPVLSTAMSAATTAGFFGMIAAVVLGALAGGPATAAVGILIAAIGAMIQAFTWTPFGFGVGLVTTGFGAGMYRPALIVSALRPFGANKQAARLALLLVIYAATNLASLPASTVSSLTEQLGGAATTGMIVFGAASSGIAALLFVGLAWSGLAGVKQYEGSISAKRLMASAVAVGVGGAGYVAWTLANDLQWAAMSRNYDGSMLLFQLNPVVNVLACLTFAGGFGMAQLAGWRPPALGVAGVGFVLAAIGFFPSVGVEYVGMPLVLACIVIGAVGEGLLWAGIMSAAVADIHWRLAMIPAAMFTAGSAGINLFSYLFRLDGGSSAGVGATILAVVVGIAGMLLVTASWPLRSWLADEPDGPAQAGVDPYGFSEAATTLPARTPPDG